jgi:hypothetical protein
MNADADTAGTRRARNSSTVAISVAASPGV